jgi:hypothetical protein
MDKRWKEWIEFENSIITITEERNRSWITKVISDMKIRFFNTYYQSTNYKLILFKIIEEE